MQIDWTLKTFAELSTSELYALLKLRNEVFVVEQNCPYADLDGHDQHSHHLLGFAPAGELAAYTRLVPAGVVYASPAIGRVVTHPQFRGGGIGRELMRRSIQMLQALYGPTAIEIGAQNHLKRFYESFGFEQLGTVYLEDGIEHIHMVRAGR